MANNENESYEIIDQPALPEEAGEKWWQKISVEPTMFLYMFAFMITTIIEQVFYVYKACRVNHGYDEETCRHLQNHYDVKTKVQITISTFQMYNNIAGHAVPIVLALFLGAWSDRRGRKLPLILGLIGKLYWSALMIVNINMETWPVEYILYTAQIPCGFTGADIAIFASCFAYVSDVSSVSDRIIRIMILDACYLATMPTGIALGNYLFRITNSFNILFGINAGLLLLSIIYSMIVLKRHTTQKQKDLPPIEWYRLMCDFFDKDHVILSMRTFFKKRPQHRRIYLYLVLLSMAFYTFARDERQMMYLYTQLKFNWTTNDYSNWRTYLSSAYVVVMMVGIPVMSRILKWPDTIIIMISTMSHGFARVVFVYARSGYLLYVGGILDFAGPIIGAVLRTITSKLVPINERGIVFAFLSVFDNAVPFFSGAIYSQVYNNTIHTYPGAILWVTFATNILVFLLILGIHIPMKGKQIKPPPGNIHTGE